MPKITVILTSFNHAKFIAEAIDSVLNQTFKDFEFIIWDDASEDNSWKIIQSYKDNRIQSFRNDVQKRGTYGLNKVISDIAKGEYIAIHHSDDVWELDKLEKQVTFLDQNKEYGAVFTNAKIINEDSLPYENKNHSYVTIFNQLNRTRYEWLNHFFYKGNALCHPSVLIRRKSYSECGLYRYGFAQLGDFDMWVRLCLKYEIFIMPEKLIKFRLLDNEANSSGNRPDVRIRHSVEYSYVVKSFSSLKTYEELQKVFPDLKKYYNKDEYVFEFLLAMKLLESDIPSSELWALSLLLELMNDKIKSKQVKKLYNFGYKDVVKLSSKFDVFGIEKDIEYNVPKKNNQFQKYLYS